MTTEEKCLLAIEKGFTYDPITGDIYGMKGGIITRTTITNNHQKGYIFLSIRIDKTHCISLRGHILAWYMTHNKIVEQIDHINGVPNDNRLCNLRPVTNQQNHFNRTKAKGYYKSRNSKKWFSRIMVDGRDIYLGTFDTEEDARQAYLDAKKIYHII